MVELQITVKNLAFGQERAEKETELFYDRFVSTQAYLNAKDREKEKLFYVGHRGSGKTALFKKLMKELEQTDSIILEISPDNYSYESLKKLEHSFYDIKSTYIYAWEYTIFTLIFNKVVEFYESKRSIKTNRDNVKAIKEFLLKNDLFQLDDNLTIFIKSLVDFSESHKKLEFKSSSPESKMNVFEFLNMINRTELFHPIQALNIISRSIPIFVFIDELDTGWDNSKEAKNFINGLLSSVTRIEKTKNLNIKFYVSLRQDMYDNLSGTFADTEKIRSSIEKLSWNDIFLKNILTKRIITKLKNSDDYDEVNKEAYKQITSQNISYESILYSVFTQEALDIIFETSLKRPREIIQFCNLCVDKIRLIYGNNSLKKIDKEIVERVQDEYIEQRITFFCEEYKFELPNLYTLISFFAEGKATYSIQDFISKLEDSIINFMEKCPSEKWIMDYCDDPKKLIEKLFEIGFIRFENKSTGVFYAIYEIDNNKKLSLENTNRIKINTIFQLNFNCSDTDKIKTPLVFTEVSKAATTLVDTRAKKKKVKIFLSYSHKDERYLKKLDLHMSMLKRSENIEEWFDRKISAGDDWNDKIIEQVKNANIVLLLISSEFLGSKYIWDQELRIIRERIQNNDGLIVIPIFVRECDTTDFDMMRFQSAQKDKQSEMPWIASSKNKDKIYREIVLEIRNVIEKIQLQS
ncbi:toll/interleukin-1 receptor domain-containing protein [Emticicia oligotrophica]|uniref:toll/interleukin-1 receptor domain-containing protein n=1 Tax=Emticicia oligotrophica TaxID=312279 RepID=UPI00273B7A32|nr:TIR domain-containing protein [Emticicia oligotrophica]